MGWLARRASEAALTMPSGARLLWCKNPMCRVGYAVSGALPDTCPCCHQQCGWTTDAPVPEEPYRLNPQDEKILKTLRILAD